MAVMTFAAIDIGSYEVSMKIFELSKKIGFRELNDVRYSLELGKGVYSNGKLDAQMLDVLCETLNDFKRMMQDFGVVEYRACGTSALRELTNPLIIVEQIYRRTGFKVEILSNAEQHFLGYKSIAAIERGFKKMIQKGTAILDVGGGSLQVSLFDKDALVTTQSLKMGSLRIRQRLQELEKTTIHYDKLVEEFIRNDLTNFQRLYLKDRDIKNVILMGDFITDMIFQEEMKDKIITRNEFMKRYEDTVDKTEDVLAQEMEIDPEYASLVVPTMVVCRSFIDIFQAEALWAPGVSLLDGIAYDYAEKKKFIRSVHNFENDILVTSKNIAKRYSSSKSHIQGTMNLCLNIFDSMKKVHGMGMRERLLIQIAALLHDCGKYISMGNVSECSYQIIMSTEIIGLSSLERKMIAYAVRYNTTAFADYDEIQMLGAGIDRESYIKIAKMTAILRLANAMDRSHCQKVKGIKTVLKDRELQMVMDSSQDISLELGLLQDKVAFFEEVFGIRLVIRGKGRV
ncbi:Ppx/GppA phosphatase family protein [Blautia difficilis]|uniref:HD domain-containing protein n=1 Tax=Blautia difficilis TaxID=2763027 RepID=A0ABR7IG30_9FIRM|nr:HD domain-containing protein [Blautia difficilis]MBC5778982.1 HD domain-containing protein [Blautia difficilis]